MSAVTPSTARADRGEIEYPSSDGQPMGETEIHVLAILMFFQTLRDALPDSYYVAADMFWYWKEGHPESCVAPDVMVIKDVGRSRRRSFFTWREGGAIPCVVFEMASAGTWREDLGEKHRLYERLGVREYFVFDPEGEYLRPRLSGYRLVDGHYVDINAEADDRLRSEELGFCVQAEDTRLRLIDGTTGAPVPTTEEQAQQERLRAEQERQQAEQERLRAEQERLRAEQADLRAEQADLRADQADHRAEQADHRADQADLRADALAAEVERLKAMLEQTRGGGPPA